jgi:hypothetical protein
MKRNDTLRDAGAPDTDPTSAPISEATEPGPPPESAEVDSILDGFGGRPRTYYAKHQPGSDGRSAAKYDAVASPVRAHTAPREIAPVILATTAELPLGRLLQEASRADEARVTVPILHVPTPQQASAPQLNARNQTTTPGMRPRRSSAGWLVPAIVVAVLVVGAAVYLTRGPAGASAPGAPSASGLAEASSVGGATSVSKVVTAAPSSSVPAAPTSATMPVLSATMVAVTVVPPPPTAPAPPSPPNALPTRPTHSARLPETAPTASVAPAPSPPRGDMKRNFE